ncbi:MAG: hypothetical protein MPEBLZ_03606 [Candidatus Methanoperedens nitroreducens]|uniref:Uncharacterized protein n=1 Tax=Candidatus Methanoperedens nitratireducens TaxID=1392998 RepID=A0A0P8CGN5_9EURY|nr:hypothetical protein [Candidatus Methanoperedens sp. BLZ2]KAB2946992.1 MAG: hypothetical protein F9K14_06025 [Candidatus Methanoperedens sp.]KPQ41847.1 MAG: hypothetical protein MPEBLZ_03606 [Candidatus Methanoperedens sp. BLZ1]MBZ0176795.1 hypothetical protein [Candidatus Methanoperedens nitroreducens]MCX9080517.1 hypothetical protein [Candidatus Methanoperedens sp.]
MSLNPACAGLLEELNSTYITDISGLPPYKESDLRPEIEQTISDHLQGWVDIVGFQNLANISGTFYICGDPAANAVVRGNARIWLQPPGINTELTRSISVKQVGANIIATLHAVLTWDTVSCDYKGCWISGSFTETHDWTDTEISPPQFIFPGPQNMIIEQYLGFAPVSLIHFPGLNDSIIFFNITTQRGSVEHLMNIGKVEQTGKGIPYMNVTPFSVWRKTGKGIYHQGDDPIMDNDTIISVFFWTPFGRAPDYDFSEYAVYHQNKHTSINPAIGFIIYVVLIFLIGIYIMYRSSRFR